MPEKTTPKSCKAMPAEFTEARFTTRVWSHTARAGTPFDVIVGKPSYWAHIASKLTAGDLVQVHAQDRSFYGELYVLTVRPKAAVVHALRYDVLPDVTDAEAPQDHKVEWAGPHHKWRVVRVSDASLIAYGFATEAEAKLHVIQPDKKAAV